MISVNKEADVWHVGKSYFDQIFVISDMEIICEKLYGTLTATDLIQMVFFM